MRSLNNNDGSVQISGAEDILAAAEIESSNFGDNAETAATLFVISRVGDLLGIRLDGKLIASKAVLYGVQCAMAVSTCVDKQNQGLGCGTRLALMMEQSAKSMGLNEVFALISPQNGPQLSIYLKKRSWRIIAYKSHYYSDEADYGLGGDRLIVAKALGEAAQFVGNEAGIRHELQSALASSHELAAARKIEAQYRRQPSSVFFLCSINLVGKIHVERSAKKVVGYFGVLRGKLQDAYIHGPFSERADYSDLLQEAEEMTKTWGTNTVWSVVPEYDRKTISNLKDAGYSITERACGLSGDGDLLRLSKGLLTTGTK